MYRVLDKQKIRFDKKVYNGPCDLPEAFIADASWIKNGIIEEIKKAVKSDYNSKGSK